MPHVYCTSHCELVTSHFTSGVPAAGPNYNDCKTGLRCFHSWGDLWVSRHTQTFFCTNISIRFSRRILRNSLASREILSLHRVLGLSQASFSWTCLKCSPREAFKPCRQNLSLDTGLSSTGCSVCKSRVRIQTRLPVVR